MPTQLDPRINWEEWEEVNPESYQAAQVLAHIHAQLGSPADPFSESGQKMMDALIAAWQYKFPQEAHEWLEERKEYQQAELDIKEQVRKHTGRTLAAYPYFIYKAMGKVFPDFKPAERNNCLRIVRKWPLFRFANRA